MISRSRKIPEISFILGVTSDSRISSEVSSVPVATMSTAAIFPSSAGGTLYDSDYFNNPDSLTKLVWSMDRGKAGQRNRSSNTRESDAYTEDAQALHGPEQSSEDCRSQSVALDHHPPQRSLDGRHHISYSDLRLTCAICVREKQRLLKRIQRGSSHRLYQSEGMPDLSQALSLNSNQIQIGVFLGGILGGLIAGWMLRGRQSRKVLEFGSQSSRPKAGAAVGKPGEALAVSSRMSGKSSPHSHGDSDWLSTSEGETEEAATKKSLRSRSRSKTTKQALKMNFLVRMDLDMGKGKICAQVAHAAVGAYEEAVRKRDPNLKAWQRYGQAKVALKVPDEDTLLSLTQQAKEAGLNVYVVRDAGRTQIAPGSLTVAAIGPGEVSAVDKITGHLKLL